MTAPTANQLPGSNKPFRSLATRYFLFNAALLLWVVLTLFAFDLREKSIEWYQWGAVAAIVVAVAAVLSRFTARLLARPLILLEQGIKSVTNGRLEPVQVSQTGDEIESLGHSFNAMIEKLVATQNEVRRQQESMAGKVRERTEELEYAMRRAQADSQARSEHVAGMSHELRTSMNGLLGMLSLLQTTPVDTEQKEQLETAQRCAKSLLNLLNEVLSVSELETGTMRLEPVACEIRALAAEIADTARGKAAARGITVSLEVTPEVPARLILDPLRVRQAITALIGLALRTTTRGWVKLRISRHSAEGGSLIAVEVIDSGSGLPPNGTDLSLSIARKLAAMHGGELNIDRREGVGSTCRFTLPCHLDSSQRAVPVSTRPQDGNADFAPILVVEDNYINQKVVTGMLRKRGYHVEVANHGLEALQRLETHDYGLILMDVQMPVLDGFETTRRIRQNPRFCHIPVVAMTALAMPGDRERCLDAGMDSYVSKPLNPIELLLVVEQKLLTAMAPVA